MPATCAPCAADAVAQGWAAIVEGREIVLRWRAGVVQIGGDPDIALSRGPFILEDPAAEPAKRWQVGQFQSIWVRDRASDAWHVLFDAGSVPPRVVDDLEAAQRYLAANSPARCEPS